jgi:hypothetical protein
MLVIAIGNRDDESTRPDTYLAFGGVTADEIQGDDLENGEVNPAERTHRLAKLAGLQEKIGGDQVDVQNSDLHQGLCSAHQYADVANCRRADRGYN